MKVKNITKEDIEIKVISKPIIRVKNKPSFSQWLLHDKKASKTILVIGAFGGVLGSVILLLISLIFDFHTAFKTLFMIMVIWQGWSGYKLLKNSEYIESSVNDIAYKGKYDNKVYESQKRQYDNSKQVGMA